MDNPYEKYRPQDQAAAELNEHETVDDPVPEFSRRTVPRIVWLWIAGILASLVLMLVLVSNGTGKDAAAPAVPPDVGDTVRVPIAPELAAGAGASSAEDLPPLPPLPPMPTAAPPPPLAIPSPAYVPPPVMPQPTWQSTEVAGSPPISLAERRAGVVTQSQTTSEDRYLQAMTASLAAGNAQPSAAAPSAAPAVQESNGVRRVAAPNRLLAEGTLLPCALETALLTDQDGPSTCQLIAPVHSMDGSRVLLPAGTRLFGSYLGVDVRRARVAIKWRRLLTPSGISADLQSVSLDPGGGAGVPGTRHSHWGSRIGGAVMISLLGDAFKYFAAKEGPRTVTAYGTGNVVEEPFSSNTADAIQTIAAQTVQESSQLRPSVSIPAGTIIHVHVDRDLDFSRVLDSP